MIIGTRRVFAILVLISALLCASSVFADNAVAPATVVTPAPVAPAPAAPAPATVNPAPTPAAPAVAPVAPAPVSPAPAAKVEPAQPVTMPVVKPDTNIFKRTPVIDGVIDEGEWDTFYTMPAPDFQATTYANWDSGNLYIAVKSDKPVDILALLDANDDGYFDGDDNYEFRLMLKSSNSPNLTVSRYDSHNAVSPTAAAVTPAEAAEVQVKSALSETGCTVEMLIPAKLIRGFKLKADRKIGLRIALKTSSDESGWLPAGAVGATEECTLVTEKYATLKPLELGFDLEDSIVAQGDDLAAKFHIKNAGTESVDVRSFVLAGEGKAGNFLNSEQIRLQGLAPNQHLSRTIKSTVPSDMRLGSWAIGAEVKSNDARLGSALISFTVVEPWEPSLNLPEKKVRADVKDVTMAVGIKCNARHSVRGTVKMTMPVGWEMWKGDTRSFAIGGRSESGVQFKAKPPLGALGEIPVKVEVTVNGKTKTLDGSFTVINP